MRGEQKKREKNCFLTGRMPVTPAEVWFADEALCAVLRGVGGEECMLTGDGAEFEKVALLLEKFPLFSGSWLYDGMREELRAFGFDAPAAADAAEVWQRICEALRDPQDPWVKAPAILPAAPEMLCFDEVKKRGQNEDMSEDTAPLLAFYPDRLLGISKPGIKPRLQGISAITGQEITDIDSLLSALDHLLDYYEAGGCHVALHDGLCDGFVRPDPYHAGEIFSRLREGDGKCITAQDAALLSGQILRHLAGSYRKRGWQMLLCAPGDAGGSCAATDFLMLLDYLVEQQRMPRTGVLLSPGFSTGLLRDLVGRYPAVAEMPALCFGMDGRRVTEADLLCMTEGILREVGVGAFLGPVLEPTCFLTRPVSRLFDGALSQYAAKRCEKIDKNMLCSMQRDAWRNFFTVS